MAEVTVLLGLKMPVPGVQYSMVEVAVTIAGIDPEGDVDAQITSALETSTQAFVRLDENIEVALTEILAPETGVPGYRERLGSMEEVISKLANGFNELLPKIKAHFEAEGHASAEDTSQKGHPPVRRKKGAD